MVNQGIVSFIRQNLEKGYDIYTIKNHLMQSGYNPKEIEDAANYVYSPTMQDNHFPIIAIVIIAIIAILLVITTYFVFLQQSTNEPSLEIELKARSEKTLNPGEKFSFQYEITSAESKKTNV